MRDVIAGMFISAVAVGSALAAGGSTNPDWLARPTPEAMLRYYPDEAMDRSISGRAVVSCLTRLDARLEACRVVEEYPVGMGFGAAAVRMAETEFRMKPATQDGKPVAGSAVRIPIHLLAPMPEARAVIFKALWASAPSFADMEAAWPEGVGDLAEGRAVLRCRVRSDGTLTNCGIAGQTPKGSPFGGAARTLVEKFRVRLTPEEVERLSTADLAISFHFFNPATPQGKARRVVSPDWIKRIDPNQVVGLFPTAAADAGIVQGVGVADCQVAADGLLSDCRVAREEPSGYGFGASAVAAATVSQVNPWTADGRPAHGVRIKLPIAFTLAPEGEAPAAD